MKAPVRSARESVRSIPGVPWALPSLAGSRPCAAAHRTSGTAPTSTPGFLPPAVPAEPTRSLLVLAQQGLQFFSSAQLQHGLAIGFLKLLELTLVLLAHFQRLAAQRVLHAFLRVVHPAFNLCGRNIACSTRCRNRRLTLNDFQHQRCFATRCPPFDVFFHHCAHGQLLLEYRLSRKSVGHYRLPLRHRRG